MILLISIYFMATHSYKGTNWGQIVLGQENIQFKTRNQPSKHIFQIKPSTISHISNTAKDIIFHLKDEIEDEGEELAEVRFHYDIKEQQMEDQEQSDKKNDASISKERVKKVCEKIRKDYLKDKMDTESLATFTDISLAVPRGKYSVDFFANVARYHGKTFSFSFKYADVSKAFLLPNENDAIISLVLKFRGDRPVCQGQTVYSAIIIQFNALEETQIEVTLPETVLSKYPHCSKLKKKYEGKAIQSFSDMLKIIGQLTFIAPNPEQFSSKNKKTFVKCGIKAQQGWLYFLKKSILFTPKPITYIKLDQIIKVSFNRVSLNNKQFDIIVKLDGEKKHSIEFLGFDHQQLDPMTAYFSKRGVKVEQEEEKPINRRAPADGAEYDDDDDESDGQFEVGQGEDEESDENDDFEEEEQDEKLAKEKKTKFVAKDRENKKKKKQINMKQQS